MKAGQMIVCNNIRTGAKTARLIKRVTPSGKKVTVVREDWKTGQAEFYFQPTTGVWKCEYASEVFA